MIKGQAEVFFSKLKHRYREVPNFGDIYNQAIKVVEKSGLPVTIKNINIVLEDFVNRRDVDHEIKLYDLIEGIFIITAFEDTEPYWPETRMVSRAKVLERWPFLVGLIDQKGFQRVKFKINEGSIIVEPYKE